MPAQPIPTYRLTPQGLTPAPYVAHSLAEAVAYEPPGVYTVARTFHGDRALRLDAHLDRLEESARLVGIPLVLDRARLRGALRELLHRAGFPDAKFRITAPRAEPETLVLSLEPFQPVPPAVMEQGARVITLPLRRANPVAKTTEWMTARKPAFDHLPPGVYEAVLVTPEGRLLEGLSSNFYGVLDGALRTAESEVLNGITRAAILRLAPEVLPVRVEALRREDVPRLEEALLTSAGRGVVPITQIDDCAIGGGVVGPRVGAIQARYDAWTEEQAEAI